MGASGKNVVTTSPAKLQEMSDNGELDVKACLRQGAIGALGAVPGTLCAHPMDVIKIRMQITGAGSYREALSQITGNGNGMKGFYRGLIPAIEQRMVARGPMFLVSELYTQNVEKYAGLTVIHSCTLGCSETGVQGVKARFVGSVGSGYTVGFLAGLAEYRKKMLSQGIITAKEARYPAHSFHDSCIG